MPALNTSQSQQRRGGLLFRQDYDGYRFPHEKPLLLERIREGLSVEGHVHVRELMATQSLCTAGTGLEPLTELPLSSAASIDFAREAVPMAYFEWRSEIEVGHPLIDEQHRKLLALGEAVVEPLLNTTEHQPGAAQLRALIDFAQEHFAFEESQMRSAGYPESDLHAKYHASLLTELKAYCVKVQQGQNTNPAGLISFLWNWLVLHIDSADRQLVVWMKARETGNGA